VSSGASSETIAEQTNFQDAEAALRDAIDQPARLPSAGALERRGN